MKIRPLSNLISGLTGYGEAQSTPAATTQQAQKSAPANDDATSVNVAANGKSDGSERAAFVASLKEQVQNGSYQRDTLKVAEALYKDLF